MGNSAVVIGVLDQGIKECKRRKVCIMDGWNSCFMLSYYDDELKFEEGELMGKTEEEVKDLFHKKDVAYLQS